jgi:hypothetical protein
LPNRYNSLSLSLDYYTVTDLLRALLGGSPVGAFWRMCRATVLWKCFLRVRACTGAIQRMRTRRHTTVCRDHVKCVSVIRSDVTQLYDECL